MWTYRSLALAASLIVASGSSVYPGVQARAADGTHCMSLGANFVASTMLSVGPFSRLAKIAELLLKGQVGSR